MVEITPKLFNPGRSSRGWHRIEKGQRCLTLHGMSESLEVPRGLSEEQTKDIQNWIDSVQPGLDAQKEVINSGPVPDPLARGSLFHTGLAHFYLRIKEQQNEGNPDKWLDPISAVTAHAVSEGPFWITHIPLVVEAVQHYVETYQRDGQERRIIGVEHEFKAQIGDYLYTQRADLIYENIRTGKIFIEDHKTAYRISGRTLDQFELDGQFIGYYLFGQKAYGPRFGGVMINRMKITPDYIYARDFLPPSPEAIRQFATNVMFWEDQIVSLVTKKLHPTLWPKPFSNQVCYGKYGRCKFASVCKFGRV